MTDDEIEEPPQLSEDAQAALRMAEERAEKTRQKHLENDQATAVRATQGASATSSGIRIDPSGGKVPGVEPMQPPEPMKPPAPIESPEPMGHHPMPESTAPPTPVSFAMPSPQQASAAEMLVPAEAQSVAREEAGRAAFALVEEQRAARRGAAERQKKDVMYYVRCQRCGGPGIWMKSRGVIGADDWWSNYKPRGVPWPSKQIWCQCCWALRKAQNPLKILHTTVNDRVVSVRAYPRMVVEIAVSKYAEYVNTPAPEPVGADG